MWTSLKSLKNEGRSWLWWKLWVQTLFMARCTRYNIMWSSLSVTCSSLVVFSGYSGFLHQENWPQRYNWNIVESGVKHHKPTKSSDMKIFKQLRRRQIRVITVLQTVDKLIQMFLIFPIIYFHICKNVQWRKQFGLFQIRRNVWIL